MIIDLRELAKSLMFAEKAKEEAEELRRDNERLYEITVEHAKLFEKDQQMIFDLKQTILNLEFKVKQLEEGTKNPTGALISKGDAERKDTDTIAKFFKSYEIDLYPSVESLIQAFERSEELYSRAFNSMNEEIRELRQSKTLEVDWTRFVSWDELSRMTINDIMEKVYKNG